MQEVAILKFCDVCYHETEQKVVAEHSEKISYNGGPYIEIETCNTHHEPIDDLIALLDSYGHRPADLAGRKPAKAAPKAKPDVQPHVPGTLLSCTVAGCKKPGPYKGAGGLSLHMGKAHGLHGPLAQKRA
jgi:hypothetical protein